jgi:thermitase
MQSKTLGEAGGMGARRLQQHSTVTGALFFALCLLFLLGSSGYARADAGVGDFVPHQVIVKLQQTGISIEEINLTYGSTTLQRFSDSSSVYLLKLPAGSSIQDTLNRMTSDERLLFSEPNYVAEPSEGDARHRAWGVSSSAPSSQDYAATALNLSTARTFSLGEGTTVAVLDTGAQLDHPALQANFEGVKRYDFVGDDNNPTERRVGADTDGDGIEDDLFGHGTHVAGIVDIVAPKAKIMPIRVLDTEGYGDVFTISRALSYAKRNGADVVNLSLGSSSRSRLLQQEIRDATADGVLVTAAAGNSNSSMPHYPAAGNGLTASADGLVAVTSVNMYGKKSDFANYGSWVDVSAPGDAIRSAFPFDSYAYWSGTSMATPFVSGEAALIHAVYGSLDPASVEGKIRCSTQPLLMTDLLYGAMLGTGRVDVGASLAPGVCS